MRAVQFSSYGPSSVLQIADIPQPHPGPGQVRIAVRAAGVTPADWYVRSGRFQDMFALTLPHVLGFDAAGTVDEIGDGVTGVTIGDEIFGTTDLVRLGGAHAEHAVLALWARKPRTWSWEQAGGAAGNSETAIRTLDLLGVKDGTTLLIDGAAGGVGTMAVQLAVARGATVIGTASPRNHEFLTTLGATPAAYGEGLIERITRLAPHGVDAALDCAGAGSLPDLITLTGSPATVVTIADFTAATHGVHMSRTGGPGADKPSPDALTTAAGLADDGKLTVPIAAVFPFTEAAAAHELSATGHARGKIILVP